jgi:hypothetical protein
MSRHATQTGAEVRANLQIKTGERNAPEWLRRALLAAPGIARLVRLREDTRNFDDPFDFVDVALRELQVQLDLSPFEAKNIPTTGDLPCGRSSQLSLRTWSVSDPPWSTTAAISKYDASAEHFVRSMKSECLNRTIFFGQAPLQDAISHFMVHCRH